MTNEQFNDLLNTLGSINDKLGKIASGIEEIYVPDTKRELQEIANFLETRLGN